MPPNSPHPDPDDRRKRIGRSTADDATADESLPGSDDVGEQLDFDPDADLNDGDWDEDLDAADDWLDGCLDDDEPTPDEGDFWWDDEDDDDL